MKKVDTPTNPTIKPDSPVAPPQKRGERYLHQAPKRTDAYSPTPAAAQAQWEKKPIYIPLGGDYVEVGPLRSPLTSPSPEGRSNEERLKSLEEMWDGPTVQSVTAAHIDYRH